ncbi:murein biosynthesis integral membrane protein MurJ [candidate division WOR-3 bacterium]|nr:murein biosynthesis integral membrane protein MurJ [candidate division WOR-3 bacterium]
MKLKKVGGFSIGTLLSRITGMGREVAFAYLFGSSALMDAFRVAFNIPNLLRDFFGEGGMNAAFVPVFSEYYSKEGEKNASEYLSSFLLPLTTILLILVSLGIIFSPFLISFLAKGFSSNPLQYQTAVKLTRIMFPFLILISLASVVMGVLTCFDRFFITGIYTVFFNISVILFSFLLYKNFGIFGAATGILAGGVIQLLFLLLFLPQTGIRLKKPRLGHPGVKQSFLLLIPVFLAYAATKINVAVTLFLASLLPAGNISHLSYAYRIMQLPLGMFGVAVAVVSLPELSRKAASKLDQYPYILASLRAVFLLSVPSVFFLSSVRLPVVRIIYEHGAFLTQDSTKTSAILLFYLLGIPFIAGTKVIGNVYFSRKDTKTPMKISYVSMIINVILAVIFLNILGARGLALAVSVSGIIQFALLIIPHRKVLKDLSLFFLYLILISFVAIIPVIYIQKVSGYILSFICGGLIFVLIFTCLGYILKIEEICKLLKKLKNR